jgi:TrmH family RNA methyltransferase
MIKNLRDRKVRKETGLFYIEGIKPVGEAFNSGWDIESIIICPELLKSEFAKGLVKQSEELNLEIIVVDKAVFKSISEKDGPKGIGAIVHFQTDSLDSGKKLHGIWVGLDSIQDPGNLGTIIRTIDSAGAKGIILIGNCVDPFSFEAVRSSMGAIFSVKIITTSTEDFILWKAKTEINLVGTSDKAGLDFRDSPYQADMILLMGSEQKGLNPALMDACSSMVSIPMRGKSDSLNLAVATGIILYEITSQLEDEKPANGGTV